MDSGTYLGYLPHVGAGREVLGASGAALSPINCTSPTHCGKGYQVWSNWLC